MSVVVFLSIGRFFISVKASYPPGTLWGYLFSNLLSALSTWYPPSFRLYWSPLPITFWYPEGIFWHFWHIFFFLISHPTASHAFHLLSKCLRRDFRLIYRPAAFFRLLATCFTWLRQLSNFCACFSLIIPAFTDYALNFTGYFGDISESYTIGRKSDGSEK